MRLIMGYDEVHWYSLRVNKRNFFINQFSSTDNWETICEIHSKCDKSLPHKTKITLKVTKGTSIHEFKIFAEIKRVDNGADCPPGLLVIRIQNIEGKKSPVKHILPCDLKGLKSVNGEFEVTDEDCKCLLSKDDESAFPDDVLIIRIRLFVLCRHHQARNERRRKQNRSHQ